MEEPGDFFSFIGRTNHDSLVYMEKLNSGYIALAFVLLIFLGLQVWWISMTIRNEKNSPPFSYDKQIDEIKQSLEKIFRS